MHVILHVGQTKPRLLFMHFKVCIEKYYVDNFLLELCLVLSQIFKLIDDGELFSDVYRFCCQLYPELDRECADDTLCTFPKV